MRGGDGAPLSVRLGSGSRPPGQIRWRWQCRGIRARPAGARPVRIWRRMKAACRAARRAPFASSQRPCAERPEALTVYGDVRCGGFWPIGKPGAWGFPIRMRLHRFSQIREFCPRLRSKTCTTALMISPDNQSGKLSMKSHPSRVAVVCHE